MPLDLKNKYRLRIENCIGTIIDVYRSMGDDFDNIPLQQQIESLKEAVKNLDVNLLCEGDVLMVERATNVLLGEFRSAFELGRLGPVYLRPSEST